MFDKKINDEARSRVRELVKPGAPLEKSKSQDIPVPPKSEAPATKCGYFVAVTEDGSIKFEIIGTNSTSIELLGLHQIAGERLQQEIFRKMDK